MERPPLQDPPLEDLVMFVSTHAFNVKFHKPGADPPERGPSHTDLAPLIKPTGALVVVNSNFGSVCKSGYEKKMKTKRNAKKQLDSLPGRKRRAPEGNGTCLNSAIELIFDPMCSPLREKLLAINRPDKLYNVKYFPSTGYVQSYGHLFEDGSEKQWIVEQIVKCIPNAQGMEYTISNETTSLVNFKTVLKRESDRVVFNLSELAEILIDLKCSDELPFPIVNVQRPTESSNVVVSFQVNKNTPQLKIFARGKINILGSVRADIGRAIYAFINGVIKDHWESIVFLQPLPDSHRKKSAPPPVKPPKPQFSAAVAGCLLEGIINGSTWEEIEATARQLLESS